MKQFLIYAGAALLVITYILSSRSAIEGYREESYNDGYSDGYQHGYNDGYDQGYEQGFEMAASHYESNHAEAQPSKTSRSPKGTTVTLPSGRTITIN